MAVDSEENGGSRQGWEKVERGKRGRSAEKEGDRVVKMVRAEEDFRVIFKLKDQVGGGFRAMNPLKVAESLRCVGEGLDARILPNGAMLLLCRNMDQVGKAMKVGKILGKRVEVIIPEKKSELKGVIYGVCADISEEEIKENIRGGKATDVKRFKAKEGGNINTPVLISFDGSVLPARVFLGCLSFQVRPYQRPPLRCFKCQRFGHMAASCRGNRRCAKCGKDHDILKCGQLVSKCCNCGGNHMASFKECGHFLKARQVQEVRDQHKISYAEALKKVEGSRAPDPVVRMPVSGPTVSRQQPSQVLSRQEVVINKEALLAFMVDVIYGAREKKSRSDVIKFVSEAAMRFLGVKDYSPQSLHEYMRVNQEQAVQESSSQPEREEEEGEDMDDGALFEDLDDV